MKKQVMIAVLTLVLAGGYYVAQAGPTGRGPGDRPAAQAQAGQTQVGQYQAGAGCRQQAGVGCRQQSGQAGCRQSGGQQGFLGRMADELGLDANQRQQIEALMTEQYEKDAPLREKIAAGREQIRTASQAGPVDEAALAELTAAQGQLMSEMMLSRIRLKNQILALLTPEQQEQAAKLDNGRGPGCGGPGCGLCQQGPGLE